MPVDAELNQRSIRLRGVRVHNLQDVDLDIPHHQLVVLCGVSGSGKTSLALDTLYAEGQRRYIESFSAYTRQFLQRLDRPDCESIEGLPPAIAVTRGGASRSNRSTIGTATETADYLRLLFAKVAELFCHHCGQPVRSDDPQSAAKQLTAVEPAARAMLGFPLLLESKLHAVDELSYLQQQGFLRLIVGQRSYNLGDESRTELAAAIGEGAEAIVIVDRLKTSDDQGRVTESMETAFAEGAGQAVALVEADKGDLEVDGKSWQVLKWSRQRKCETCQITYPDPEPRLFNFNNPLGACPACEGFGDIVDVDMDLVVPDRSKTLREGAIQPWNTPSYQHELEELLELADDYDLPVDVPFSKLTKKQRRLIDQGVPERDFGGLQGFFAWLERKKYKMPIRVFLSRWRSYRQCTTCDGKRLKEEVLAYRVAGKNIAEICAMEVDAIARFFADIQLQERESRIADDVLHQLCNRLGFLQSVGLGYLQLDRTLRTLSGGEAQRVALTSALGSSLVNMLYVLDEPTAGLHPADVPSLIESIVRLRDRGNTVAVVEHNEAVFAAADRLIEVGPGAGTAGGQIVFEGTADEMLVAEGSLTGDFMAGRRGMLSLQRDRLQPRGWLKLTGASGNNLQSIDVEFPLGVLCVVTGVSGSGKSSLVHDTLYGAICRRKKKSNETCLPYEDLVGDGQLEDVLLVDQSPISRSPRSNPVTYVKAFDSIRRVFAETLEARTRNFGAGHFSFNSAAGRCEACEGDGMLQIDMQFLADIYMQCPECKGTRYRDEILKIRYRDRNIADVLKMTVRQAVSFFRGYNKVQEKLSRLTDVGLDYLQLGQPANTLSSGEAQRLKLAAFLSTAKRRRTLFLMDEPTTGLHVADIVKLLGCFDTLLADGHSLIVVEHNLRLIKAADYIIDMGPGAAGNGGRVVAAGEPEAVQAVAESVTGQVLAQVTQPTFDDESEQE